MKVSWVILTHNRAEVVQKAFRHNCDNAGAKWDELIWVDNGSDDVAGVGSAMGLHGDVVILNKVNRGVPYGYNMAMAAARGDLIAITGCDCLMPDNWLKTWITYFEKIPQTGVASIYTAELQWVKERMRKPVNGDWNREEINGLPIVHAMPMGRRMFRRELLAQAGYEHEGFGLYGWSDVEWGYRMERVCDERGLLYYVIPDCRAEHLGTEGVKGFDNKDSKEYHEWKQKEVKDPKKAELMAACRTKNYPFYSPF